MKPYSDYWVWIAIVIGFVIVLYSQYDATHYSLDEMNSFCVARGWERAAFADYCDFNSMDDNDDDTMCINGTFDRQWAAEYNDGVKGKCYHLGR